MTEQFVDHYNNERPNQALSCGNRPPRTAFPSLPTLPRPPEQIEADGWLKRLDGLQLERKVDAHGTVQVDLRRYYVDAHRAGQRVTLEIQAASQSLRVWQEGILLKTLRLRGLVETTFSFEHNALAHGSASTDLESLAFLARTQKAQRVSGLLCHSRCGDFGRLTM